MEARAGAGGGSGGGGGDGGGEAARRRRRRGGRGDRGELGDGDGDDGEENEERRAEKRDWCFEPMQHERGYTHFLEAHGATQAIGGPYPSPVDLPTRIA